MRDASGALWGWIRCPRCHSRGIAAEGACAGCPRCGSAWPLLDGSIPYFAQGLAETDRLLRSEIESQQRAVSLYENSRRLAFHWDRHSMLALGNLLAGTPDVVLDIGCGTGRFAVEFPQFRVVGVDVTPGMLRVARHRCALAVGADARELPFEDGVFEACFARSALHHMHAPDAGLQEIHRVMTRGGQLVLFDPRAFRPMEFVKRALRRRSKFYSESHRAFPRAMYRRMIEAAGFEVERFEDWDPIGLLLLTVADGLRLGFSGQARLMVQHLLKLDDMGRLFLDAVGREDLGFTIAVRARRT